MSQNPDFEVAQGNRALRAESETSFCFRDNAQAYEAGYTKALDDYAVVDLLRKLKDFDAIDEEGRSIAPSIGSPCSTYPTISLRLCALVRLPILRQL